MSPSPTVFALDFGTTNSLLAAAAPGASFDPVPLDPLASDPTILRSALHFVTEDDVVFGQAAMRRYIGSGFRGRLLRSIKRHLTWRGFDGTRIGSSRVTLEDITGAFLRSMRESACRFFGADVTRAVLGRPARFSNRSDEDALAEARLGKAAKIAGFREVWFCYEPVAAAYDYAGGFDEARTVLIADLGGGTSDFTIARMTPGAFSPSDVLAVGGVSVAGDAFDGAMVRALIAPLLGSNAPYRVPLGSNILTMPGDLLELLCSPAQLSLGAGPTLERRLDDIRRCLLDKRDEGRLERYAILLADSLGFQFYEAVESAKVRLSRDERAVFRFDYPGIDLEQPISRIEFEGSVTWPLERILEALDATLSSAGLRPAQVEIACLTGGTSLVPLVEAALKERLTGAKVVRLRSHHSVVQGLARCAKAQEEGALGTNLVPYAEAEAPEAPRSEFVARPLRDIALWYPAPQDSNH